MSFADSMQAMDDMNGDEIRINKIRTPLLSTMASKIAKLFSIPERMNNPFGSDSSNAMLTTRQK
ncbi:hypothetical protein [Pseudomonas sp.]|jgi:hypothetical protein|uniref:hypothetical protein n=1 Tax=Pseudomonas sp. TaxID=306 RepID=UPI0028AD9C15|nr:hypothetical protein [Pseudomonas sp.]